jgi:hypothetical protein
MLKTNEKVYLKVSYNSIKIKMAFAACKPFIYKDCV